MRVVFAGTPAFAAAHLEALLNSPFEVVAVYTQPDRPSGRGKKPSPSPVKVLAQARDLPVFQPESLKAPEEVERLRALDPDVLVVVAYGLILPPAILAVPHHGCLNVHASLLPRWRGAAPIERAILAGDAETGVTIMQMDAGLDTGDMLMRLSTPIGPADNSAVLTERLVSLGQSALLDVLQQVSKGSLQPERQDDNASSYAAKLDKAEALIDWTRPASAILRQINAFFPRSPAWTPLGEDRLRVLEGRVLEDAGRKAPGTILQANREGIDVACGEGALRLTRLQLPGRNAVSAAELLNARREHFAAGRRLGATA